MSDDDAARLRHAAEIFDEIVDLPGDEQGRRIEAASAGDVALRAQVEALLRADATSSHLLDRLPDLSPISGAVAVPEPAEPVDRSGELVGPYRILRLVGRGGMGDVFLAERADGQFEQRVALKVVRHEFASPSVVRRFLRERQILARLRHPNIAPLLDGGVSAGGEPWFAMEYVDGLPITVAADRQGLALEARLALWLDACAAVQYAHRNLVVHRDIKPGNVLVTAEGQVRLVDFGIATVLDPRLEDAGGATTIFGGRLLTPAYAAPEQVRGGPVTTTTDVYALGALLYELLCGRRAIEPGSPMAAEVERAICEREPVAPSRRVSRARARLLRGDLDTIALTALAKAPERRYASVEAMAEDVRRHLTHRPIRARPHGMGYHADRFVRRHRVAVAAAAVAMAAVVGGGAVAVWQARRATAEARRATAVSEFLVGLFETADPEHAGRSDVTARELVDRGVARLDSTLADNAALRVELLVLSGTIYRKLGHFEPAILALERAAEAAGEKGVNADARPQALLALGTAYKEAGQRDRAESALRRAVEEWRRLGRGATREAAAAMGELANAIAWRGAHDEAERLHREVLAIDTRLLGRDHLDVATDLDNLGTFLLGAGKYDEADRAFADALAIARRSREPAGPVAITILGNLAVLRSAQGRHEESLVHQREVLAARRRVYGDAHPDVAISLSNIASTLSDLGRLEDAQRAWEEALAIHRRQPEAPHPDRHIALNGLAIVAYRRGDLVAAIGAMREAVAAWQASAGEDGPAYLTGINNLGVMLCDAGEFAEAEALLRKAAAGRERVLGASHPEAAHARRNLAVLLHRTGRDGEAEALARAAFEVQERQFAPDHARRVDAAATLGAILLARGRARDAEPLLRTAADRRRAQLGEDHPDTLEARGLLGACLLAHGDPSGRALLVPAHEALAARPGQQQRARELARYLPMRQARR